jgi:predicted CDP-diglyceride synthetase/phosphatidate cytidylyltransferase
LVQLRFQRVAPPQQFLHGSSVGRSHIAKRASRSRQVLGLIPGVPASAASFSAGAIQCIVLPRIVFQTFPVAILETVDTKNRASG